MMSKAPSDRLLLGFAYLFMTVFSFIAILPFLAILSTSITSESEIMQHGFRLWPSEFSLDAYRYVLGPNSTVLQGYMVTTTVTVAGTLISMLVTSMMAFALSRKEWMMANPLSFLVYFTMLFSGGLVPWYLITTQYLHLQNNLFALFLPYTINAFNLIILRNFISGIDKAIFESARIDGANDIRLLFNIALPLSLPGMATICLFYAVSYWNDWWLGLMLISDRELYPLQLLLRSLMSNISYATSGAVNSSMAAAQIPVEGVKMATTILTIGPVILLYPALQRYFIKGLTIGSVKG